MKVCLWESLCGKKTPRLGWGWPSRPVYWPRWTPLSQVCWILHYRAPPHTAHLTTTRFGKSQRESQGNKALATPLSFMKAQKGWDLDTHRAMHTHKGTCMWYKWVSMKAPCVPMANQKIQPCTCKHICMQLNTQQICKSLFMLMCTFWQFYSHSQRNTDALMKSGSEKYMHTLNTGCRWAYATLPAWKCALTSWSSKR